MNEQTAITAQPQGLHLMPLLSLEQAITHLTRAIKAELGDGWKPWPTFNDSDGWWTAYDAAVKHAEAKVKPEAAPALHGCPPGAIECEEVDHAEE